MWGAHVLAAHTLRNSAWHHLEKHSFNGQRLPEDGVRQSAPCMEVR